LANFSPTFLPQPAANPPIHRLERLSVSMTNYLARSAKFCLQKSAISAIFA
jgi:hypothetical protein